MSALEDLLAMAGEQIEANVGKLGAGAFATGAATEGVSGVRSLDKAATIAENFRRSMAIIAAQISKVTGHEVAPEQVRGLLDTAVQKTQDTKAKNIFNGALEGVRALQDAAENGDGLTGVSGTLASRPISEATLNSLVWKANGNKPPKSSKSAHVAILQGILAERPETIAVDESLTPKAVQTAANTAGTATQAPAEALDPLKIRGSAERKAKAAAINARRVPGFGKTLATGKLWKDRGLLTQLSDWVTGGPHALNALEHVAAAGPVKAFKHLPRALFGTPLGALAILGGGSALRRIFRGSEELQDAEALQPSVMQRYAAYKAQEIQQRDAMRDLIANPQAQAQYLSQLRQSEAAQAEANSPVPGRNEF